MAYKSLLSRKLIQWSLKTCFQYLPTTFIVPSTEGATVKEQYTSYDLMKLTFIQTCNHLWCCCDWLKWQAWFFYDVWSSNKNISYISEISFSLHDLPPNHFPNSICSHILDMKVVLADSELLTFSRPYHAILPFSAFTHSVSSSRNEFFLPVLTTTPHTLTTPSLLTSISLNLIQLTWLISYLNHRPFGSVLSGINPLSSIFLECLDDITVFSI